MKSFVLLARLQTKPVIIMNMLVISLTTFTLYETFSSFKKEEIKLHANGKENTDYIIAYDYTHLSPIFTADVVQITKTKCDIADNHQSGSASHGFNLNEYYVVRNNFSLKIPK